MRYNVNMWFFNLAGVEAFVLIIQAWLELVVLIFSSSYLCLINKVNCLKKNSDLVLALS